MICFISTRHGTRFCPISSRRITRFRVDRLRDSRVAVAEVIAAARSRPMFAVRRVVVVRDASCLEGDEAPSLRMPEAPGVQLPDRACPEARSEAHLAQGARDRRSLLRVRHRGGGRSRGIQAVTDLRQRGSPHQRTAAASSSKAARGTTIGFSSELDKIASFLATEDATRDDGRRPGGRRGRRGVPRLGGDRRHPRPRHGPGDRGTPPGSRCRGRALQVLGALAWRTRAIVQARAMVEGAPAGRRCSKHSRVTQRRTGKRSGPRWASTRSRGRRVSGAAPSGRSDAQEPGARSSERPRDARLGSDTPRGERARGTS